MRQIIKFITVIILFLLSACGIQEINFDDLNISENSHQFEIAVDCYITTELQHHYIKLTKPANYPNNTQLMPTSDAFVQISSNNKTYKFSETEEAGIYISTEVFAPQVSEIYNLYIKNGDKEYFASDSIIPVDEIDFSKLRLPRKNTSDLTPGQHSFMILKHDFGYQKMNKWLWLSAWEFDSITSYPVFASSKYYNYTHIGGEPQGLFSDNNSGHSVAGTIQDSLKVYKFSLSDAYSEYLYALFCETDWASGIFSSISGNLPTNISSGGIGFFYIMDIDYKKIATNDLIQQ